VFRSLTSGYTSLSVKRTPVTDAMRGIVLQTPEVYARQAGDYIIAAQREFQRPR
jgi:hypothetical protein